MFPRGPCLLLPCCTAAELAARDPEWFEKIDKLTPADLVAVAEEFTKTQVAKVQHGECPPQQLSC